MPSAHFRPMRPAPTMSTRLSFVSPSISFRCFASSSVMKLVLFSTVVQTLHRGNERARAGADAQSVIGDGLAARERDGLLFRVNVLHRPAEHGGDVVLLVEVVRAVLEHFFLGRLAEQHIGNERTAVNVIRFGGDDRDGADLVRGADALDGADRCGAVADDYVFHSAHLSS